MTAKPDIPALLRNLEDLDKATADAVASRNIETLIATIRLYQMTLRTLVHILTNHRNGYEPKEP